VFDSQKFIVESHEKIIGHYQQLLKTAKSEEERESYLRAVAQHEQSLRELVARRAA
jgi:hypothetical protein